MSVAPVATIAARVIARVIGCVPDDQGRIAIEVTAKDYAALLLGHDPSRTLLIRIVDGPADLRVVHVERDPEDRRNGPVVLHIDGRSVHVVTLARGGRTAQLVALVGAGLGLDGVEVGYSVDVVYLGRSIKLPNRRPSQGGLGNPVKLALGDSVEIECR